MTVRKNVRLISKLETKPPYLVKPIVFEGLRKIGILKNLIDDPIYEFIDEFLYNDVVASLFQRDIFLEEFSSFARKINKPICAGGGVKSIEDFSDLIRSGADKVSINTYAINENPSIINQAAKLFGSQSVVVNIEAKKWKNEWECYSNSGKIPTGRNVIDWAREVEDRGAGEILLQSVDGDGLEEGFEIELAKSVVENAGIPIVIASGIGKLEHIKDLILYANPSGIAIASILHYKKYSSKQIYDYLKSESLIA